MLFNLPGSASSFSPAFGNFFQRAQQILGQDQPMPWSNTGASSGGVFLASPTQIEVTQAGFYYVHYTVSAAMVITTGLIPLMAIFINNNEVPNLQTRNLVNNNETDRSECTNITLGTIIFIPSGALVELRQLSPTGLVTCDDIEPSAVINLIKLS